MFNLKAISAEAIPEALSKAERYRLLSEPEQAESICQDILGIEPNNQQALIILILSLSDHLTDSLTAQHAQRLLPRLDGKYEQNYYRGIIAERLGRAHMNQHAPGSGFQAYECFREAMDWFEKAENLRPPHNDDAILRWNACVRTLSDHSELRPRPEESYEPIVGE